MADEETTAILDRLDALDAVVHLLVADTEKQLHALASELSRLESEMELMERMVQQLHAKAYLREPPRRFRWPWQT